MLQTWKQTPQPAQAGALDKLQSPSGAQGCAEQEAPEIRELPHSPFSNNPGREQLPASITAQETQRQKYRHGGGEEEENGHGELMK